MSEPPSDDLPAALRMLAAEGTAAPETEEPAPAGVSYDVGLQADLIEWGPQALAEYGRITVRDTDVTERYAAAVWYALAHDLAYERRDTCTILTDPKGADDPVLPAS